MLPIGVDTWGPGAGHEGRGWVWPGGLRTRPSFALALRPPAAGLGPEAAPAPRNMDTFCRPAAPAQQWQHDKSETRSNSR